MYHGGSSNITYRGTEGSLPGRHRTICRDANLVERAR
jgi:hypothetical protein